MRRFKKLFVGHRRFWTWFVLAGISLFILALLLLPHGLRWGAQWWLRKQGLQGAVVKAIEFNPFSGRIGVYSVFSFPTEDSRMNLGRSEIRIDWRPLLSRRVNISGFTIENVLIDVNRAADGTVSIGGLVFKPQPSTPSSGKPWEISVGPINLHNVSFVVRDPRVQSRIDIWDAHVDPMDSARPDRPTAFALAMGINGGSLRLAGETRPFKIDSTTTAAMRLTDLPLEWLDGLAREQGIGGLGGNLDASANLKIRPSPGAVAVDCISTVSLQKLCFTSPKANLANATLNWGGRVSTTTDALKVAGLFKVSDLNTSIPAQKLTLRQKELIWRGELIQNASAVPIKMKADVTARGIRVTSSTTPLLRLDEAALQLAKLEVTTATQKIAGALKLKGLRADAQGMTAEQQEFNWRGNVVSDMSVSQNIEMKCELGVKDFSLRDRGSSVTLARFGSVSLKDVSLHQGKTWVKLKCKLDAGGIAGRLVAQNVDFKQDKFTWAGGVDYDAATGDLKSVANIGGGGISVRDFRKDIGLARLRQFDVREAVLEMKQAKAGPQIALSAETNLAGLRARIPGQGLSVWQENLNWKGRVNYAAGKRDGIEHEGDLKIEGLTVEDRRNGLNVMDMDELTVRQAKFQSPETVSVKTVRIGRTRLLERPLRAEVITTHSHTVAFKEFELGGINYNGKRAEVESVRANGLVGVFVRQADGSLELQKWTGALGSNTDSGTSISGSAKLKESGESEKEPLQFRIGRITLDGENRVLVRDGSAKPPAFLSLRQIQLNVEGIDSTTPDFASPFTFSAGVGRYAKVNAAGTVSPLAATPSINYKSSFESIELPVFSGYTQQYIGYKLVSGTLSLNTEMKLDKGILKAQNDLTLRMFELERLRPDEADALSAQLGYPVNTALAMLRDGNGDINLKIPIEGDLRNPQVGILGVVRKALLNGTANSIRSAMAVIYAPLGAVVSAGGKMTGLSLAIKPIIFEPGQAVIAPEGTAYLDKVAAVMKSRPGVRVSFSGKATRGDQIALDQAKAEEKFGVLAKLRDKKIDDETIAKLPPLEPAQKQELTRLANRRASAAVDYLVKAGIKGDRLFRRAASVDEAKGAKPRVDIMF